MREQQSNDETGKKPQQEADKALFLDMGQGSREQAFRLQKPQLTLVHSR